MVQHEEIAYCPSCGKKCWWVPSDMTFSGSSHYCASIRVETLVDEPKKQKKRPNPFFENILKKGTRPSYK